jgi:hypothetical protein
MLVDFYISTTQFFFFYSYVHTRLGSFLPPAPTPQHRFLINITSAEKHQLANLHGFNICQMTVKTHCTEGAL